MNLDVAGALMLHDRWLETMRGEGGYTGPVSHWWASSLLYSGPMIDWRYEGIICGYITLAEVLGPDPWLSRAIAAAEDAVGAQLRDGRFMRSSFQIGPMEGGTPHEAAVDVGLFTLAAALRERDPDRSARYAACAARNVERYQIACLWSGAGFSDQPGSATRVANKNATTIDALIGYQRATGVDVTPYLTGAVGVIEEAFVDSSGDDPRAGGTIHLGTGPYRLVVPFYTARCVCALATLDGVMPEPRYRRLGIRMAEFLVRSYERDGFLFGYTATGQAIANPAWVAAGGEILRALVLADRQWALGLEQPIARMLGDLLRWQRSNGSWATAMGFARRGTAKPFTAYADLRDVLPVVGWNDKAFRALALCLPRGSDSPRLPLPASARLSEPCRWRGKRCHFREDDERFMLVEESGERTIYEWMKGTSFPCRYRL